MPVDKTKNFIHVRVRDAEGFEDDTFSNVTIDKDKGITALVGRLKEKKTTTVQKFMVSKAKKWTKRTAVKWVKDHGYAVKGVLDDDKLYDVMFDGDFEDFTLKILEEVFLRKNEIEDIIRDEFKMDNGMKFVEVDDIEKDRGDGQGQGGKPQGDGGCLRGDTKISLLDGRELEIEKIVREFKEGKELWVYSSTKNGGIRPAKIIDAKQTISNAEMIEVVLDNKESIICTLDHLFRLRSGEYKEACELKPKDSLMPLYRKIVTDGKYSHNRKGYETAYDYEKQNWLFTHLIIRDFVLRKRKNSVVHHKDFDSRNNSPENLENMSWKKHNQLHGKITSERNRKNWKNPEYRKRMTEMLKKNGHKVMKKLWENPSFRQESIKRSSVNGKKAMKKNWSNPKFIENHKKISSKRMKQNLKDKDFIKKRNAGSLIFLKALNANPTEAMIKSWKKNFKKGNELSAEQMKLRAKKNSIYMKSYIKKICAICGKEFNNPASYAAHMGHHKRKNELMVSNHKVVEIKKVDCLYDGYDLTVTGEPNFALTAGIFVHNSDYCECPGCGYTAKKEKGVPCIEKKCPKCGSAMVGKDKKTKEDGMEFTEKEKEEGIITHEVPIMKINLKKRIVYGVVYSPMSPDSHTHYMTEATVEEMAHRWMIASRKMDEQHDFVKGSGVPVESFIVREGDLDFVDKNGDALVGAWVLGTKVTDERVWKKVAGGKIKAYSIAGVGVMGKAKELDSEWVDEDGNETDPYGEKE